MSRDEFAVEPGSVFLLDDYEIFYWYCIVKLVTFKQIEPTKVHPTAALFFKDFSL